MTKVFYVYRYQTDRKGNRYTPSYTLSEAYPEWDNTATIVDERIQTNIPLGKRLGWIECDDAIAAEVVTEVQDNGIGAMMKYITNDEAVAYMQGYTDYTEVEPRKFELQAAETAEESDTGEAIEAEYLEIPA